MACILSTHSMQGSRACLETNKAIKRFGGGFRFHEVYRSCISRDIALCNIYHNSSWLKVKNHLETILQIYTSTYASAVHNRIHALWLIVIIIIIVILSENLHVKIPQGLYIQINGTIVQILSCTQNSTQLLECIAKLCILRS